MNQGLALPKEGWTYCPKCDAENMICTELGKRFDCPMCGLAVETATIQVAVTTAGVRFSQALDIEAMTRYHAYQTKQATKKHEAEQAELLNIKMPRRVRLCLKLFNFMGWWFRCECRVIRDKKFKQKEVTL